MLLARRAQTSAEYAIMIGAVVALVLGVGLSALRGGVRRKTNQSVAFFTRAGVGTGGLDEDAQQFDLYQQEVQQANIDETSFHDRKLLYKGGAEQTLQQQETRTTAITTEGLEPVQETMQAPRATEGSQDFWW